MKEGHDPMGPAAVVSSKDRPLVSEVLREVSLDRLTFPGHRLLDPLDRSEVDLVGDTIRGREVGGVEVEIDTDRVLRPDRDVVGDPKDPEEISRIMTAPP